MDKQELLNEVRHGLASGQISKEELLQALSLGGTQADQASRHMNLSEILYYVGGGIVFLGICVLCYQNWDSFISPLRIIITLGSCVASLLVAILLNRYEHLRKVAQAFFLLFGLLAPLGVGVTLKEAGFDLASNGLEVVIYALLTAVFFGVFWYFKQVTILLLFAIVFATTLFHFLISSIVGNSLTYTNVSKVWEYQFMVIGLAYMFLGYYLQTTPQRVLTGVLYGFGALGFLGSTLALGGWQPSQNAFWELVYPLLVFGIIFISVWIKAKSFLVFGTIFLIAYILKLTGEYFTSGLGWPLALVLAGLVIMVVGYYAVRINKKYLTPAV